MIPRAPRRSFLLAWFGLLVLALGIALAQHPAYGGTLAAASAQPTTSTIGDSVPGLGDLDVRGHVLPTAAQRSAAGTLGAVDLRWNQFGTPASILPADGSLGAETSSDPVTAARSWLAAHAAVFGRTPAQMRALSLVSDQRLARSPARAVLFRQEFGGLAPALDSMVTVGVARGQIAYVSSSLTRTTGTPPGATMSPLTGWLKAAANVGRAVPSTSLADITQSVSGGWTRLHVPGFAQEQQVRLRSLAMADGSVRPVFEANVVDVAQGSAFAYTVMVDAVTGQVLHRQNQVDNSSDVYPFSGEITADACGPRHEFELTDDQTKSIVATAAMANTLDDIVVKIFAPNGDLLASADTGTSPEAATYTADSIPKGIYSMQVCPFTDPTVPFTPPGNYAAGVATSDQSSGTPSTGFEPRWRYFTANPSLGSLGTTRPGNSVIGCWTAASGCTSPTGPFVTVAEPGPWDTDIRTGLPTLTTVGNNATTHEAWGSPLTPGGTEQAPISPTRDYTEPFTDAWNNSRCDPTNLHPGGNDINAVVTNLFVSHNRMHDYAYYLGFTEKNYNLQQDNMSRGGTGGDPEIGNAEAGGLTGGAPTYEGRDNANQIALQDGVPGITNQYLFQPIAGSFYSPCADGALDMTVVGHEYTHAISNRMVGGPDEGLTSAQGGAMGESWSDLNAMEYLFSHHYSTGVSPSVIGPYATGNFTTGIRDYDLA
ncbi:MAG TPA: M36 family metallopeptidase, partial [Nocardioides sp.]|uniref:M36 family metallopeptidase n=1 Tax=Nocardioides sp. TaxID=35761 RepID=UPI002F424272